MQKSRFALMLIAGLTLTNCETTADPVGPRFAASLTGSQEVPGPGDPDGAGTADIKIADGTTSICYELVVRNIAPATAAHIHRGERGVAGPPVVPLAAPTSQRSEACVDVTDALAAEIKANPSAFYVNVHNAEFQAGAIRGQLGG
jgi:hypothetical protein